MNVSVITVPYDSGHVFQRMGAGPVHLLQGGLEEALRRARHQTEQEDIHAPEGFRTEISTSFALYRQLAEQVRSARVRERFPLVLAGNCGAATGVVAGLPPRGLGVVWLDSHGDFNTPETTESGFLDGMGLAILTGQCWHRLARAIPGFAPVSPTQVLHIGGRSFGAAERSLLQQSGLPLISPLHLNAGDATWPQALLTFSAQVSHCYVHVDLDVLDAIQVGRANTYASPGGLTVAQVVSIIAAVQQQVPIQAATLASYDPQADADGRVLAAALSIAQQVVDG